MYEESRKSLREMKKKRKEAVAKTMKLWKKKREGVLEERKSE